MNKYKSFIKSISKEIAKNYIFTDKLTRLVYGTDASCYTLIPQVVIKAQNQSHVISILKYANKYNLSVTFRGAGTSLSGQSICDSILVIVQEGWKDYEILNNGTEIKLDSGIIVSRANEYLKPFNKKLGPDPATSNVALIGGVVNNNSSGMCCGVHQNTYHSIKDITIILQDGTILDTSDESSVISFKKTHSHILNELENLAKSVDKDIELKNTIINKYKIKNTTGYSINSLVDYGDGMDILKHLIVGSEGTLAFVSNITYKTVDDFPHKASSLVFFNNISDACACIIALEKLSSIVESAEFMDRTSLKTIENEQWVPKFIKNLDNNACAILIQTASYDIPLLESNINTISREIEKFNLASELFFTKEPKEYDKYWKIRKGLFPKVGALRRENTSVIIEDITFKIEDLEKGTLELRQLLNNYNFEDSIIFGHALAGNLHFVLCVDFSKDNEVKNYDLFMSEMTNMVAIKYGGSLKAEHGTGRNIAPFVIKEWGEKAYSLMVSIKNIFDPKNMLNPDVIITKDPLLHLKNFKKLNQCNEIIDKCIECGFCEPTCPSLDLSYSPRQRIVAYRYLHGSKDKKLTKELQKNHRQYSYRAVETCAGCSLCSTVCPVNINTGDLTKEIRYLNRNFLSTHASILVAKFYPFTLKCLRFGLISITIIKKIFPNHFIKKYSTIMNKVSFGLFPVYRSTLPSVANIKELEKLKLRTSSEAITINDKFFIYFVSCMNKVFGNNNHPLVENKSIYQAFESLANKAGYKMIPIIDNSLCCGMPFYSKGFRDAANIKNNNLEEILLKESLNGKIPIVTDLSSCTLQMTKFFKNKNLKIFDLGKFIYEFLSPNLVFNQVSTPIALHVNCSAKKLEETNYLISLAKMCSLNVIIPQSVSCCGFAGDKGFFTPQLNTSALKYLKKEVGNAKYGFSTNSSCEIGLSEIAQIPYTSIIYMVDKVTTSKTI